MFCSKCGTRLPDAPALAFASAPGPAPAATPAPHPPRRIAGIAKTMIGVPTQAPEPALAEPTPEPSASAAAPPEPAEAGSEAKPAPHRRIAGSARTMLGMPAPDRALVAQAVAEVQARAAARAASEGTQQGLGPAAQQATAASAPSPGANGPSADRVATERGLAPAAGAALEAADTIDESATKRAVGSSNRTMLGQPAPRVPVPDAAEVRSSAPPAARGRAPVVYPSDAGEHPSDSGEQEGIALPKKRSAAPAIAMLAIGLLVLLAGGVLLAYSLVGGSNLRASVVQGENGEMLQIEVPGAAPGTRVRFHGQEAALEAGRARFPLSADDLSLGDNELTVDVVAPDGTVETETIALHLELRVRADLGPLAGVPPAIDVVVEVPPGSEVTLDGTALELDAQGRGTRRYEIDAADANAEGVVEHVVRYRVVPPSGDAAQGDLRTRIPITTLQIDRPGERLVTERDSVEVAGAVAPESTVTVGGEPVEVRLGRFLATRPLPHIGEHTIEVVARTPGKAPRVARIVVRRVEDLEAEAERFEVDEELTYARIAQNPATYRGRNVAFEGVVFNVDVRNGRSVLQMLVSDCPAGTQCPLWVTYPAATEAENRSRVRVLGTVHGEQQYRSQSGEIRTVPRVDATFVLPAPEPSGGRRR